MINSKIKFGFVGALVLLLASSCSDHNLDPQTETNDGEILSNEEMALIYGGENLRAQVSLKNASISLQRLTGGSAGTVQYSTFSAGDYQQPDLSGATKLSGSSWVNLGDNKTYYIEEGDTFIGGLNFGQNVTLVVLGKIGGNNWFTIKNNATVIFAPTAELLSSTSFTVENSTVDNYGKVLSANFNLNGAGVLNNYGSIAEFQLAENSALNNYGTAVSSKSGIDGVINNYRSLTFTQSTTLNNPGTINNECTLVFNGHININADIANNSYTDFQDGFLINASGNLVVGTGSLTDITGGQITINGKVKNTGGGNARLDIVNTTIGWLNATPAFTGALDINTDLEIPADKVDPQVSFNGDTYVAESDCMPSRGSSTCDDTALTLTLAATVQSPEVNGARLSATDVKVVGNHAYVSYHTNDEVYGDAPNGAIRIFDVQNKYAPVLVNEAQFNNAEFNGIDVDGTTLYAVGGNKAGARLVTSPLTNGTFNENSLSVFETHKLQSTAGKNSFVHNNMLWLVSGATNGGFFKLNTNDFDAAEQLYADGANAKYVAQNGTHQAFFAVDADGAYLRIANIDGSNATVYNYPSLVQTVTNGKNVITMDSEYVYVALSERGVAKVRIADGEMVNHFEPNQYRLTEEGPKVFRNNGYTNGVAVNDCYLYLANGADGVIVLNKNSFQVVGHFSLEESANYVYAQDGLLFVATGRNGLNIIKIN